MLCELYIVQCVNHCSLKVLHPFLVTKALQRLFCMFCNFLDSKLCNFLKIHSKLVRNIGGTSTSLSLFWLTNTGDNNTFIKFHNFFKFLFYYFGIFFSFFLNTTQLQMILLTNSLTESWELLTFRRLRDIVVSKSANGQLVYQCSVISQYNYRRYTSFDTIIMQYCSLTFSMRTYTGSLIKPTSVYSHL